MDSSDDGALMGLALVFVAIIAVGYVIALIIYAVVLAVALSVAVGVGLAVLVGVGICANLGLRSLVGICGDWSSVTAAKGRFALAITLLAPLVVMVLWPLAMVVAQVGSSVAWAVWLAVLLVSVPTYYWTHWAREIPHIEIPRLNIAFGPVPFDVPFKTDAAMRAEEQLLMTHAKAWMGVQELRLRLLMLRTSADVQALPFWQKWIERSDE